MTKEGAVSSHHQVSVKFCIRVRANVTDAIDPNRDTRTEIAVLNIKMQKADGLKARFSFSILVTKTDFALLWHTGENEYRQKAFLFDAQKCLCRYPGGFQRRSGEACLWHTILLARSSVLYLLFRRAGKGVMSPSGRHTFARQKRQTNTTKDKLLFVRCFVIECGRERKVPAHAWRNKGYIKALVFPQEPLPKQ